MSSWLRVATLALVLRSPLVVIAPLVHQIVDGGDVSERWIGLSIGLSLFCFSLGAAVVPVLGRRWREQNLIRLCLLVCAAGTVVRSVGGVISFVAGSLTIGVAIGVLNVVMPGYAARHTGPEMKGASAVTFGLNVGAIASVLAVSTLAPYVTSWRGLACVPLVFLVAAWLLPEDKTGRRDRASIELPAALRLRHLRGWPTVALVTVFMGLQASGYYIFLTWMPFALVADGQSGTVAGLVVAANQVGQMAVAVMVATGPRVLRQTRMYTPLICLGAVGGLSILVASPWLIPLVCVLFGIGHGAALSMAFHLIADKSVDRSVTTQMSMVAHLFGYAIAGCAPALAGLSVGHDSFAELLVGINVAAALGLLAIVAALRYQPRAWVSSVEGVSS